MLPITPNSFPFFCDKWLKKLNQFNDNQAKNAYVKKISNELWTFANSDSDNTLVPYVKEWCDKVSHKSMNINILIDGLEKLKNDDSKLIL